MWFSQPFWTIKGISWPRALKKSRLQLGITEDLVSLCLSALPSHPRRSRWPFQPLPLRQQVAAALFQRSHPQASPCRRGEGLLVVAPTQGVYFLPPMGPDWVSGDVLIDSNQSVPTSGAGSGLPATETKSWEWAAGGHCWQERSWGAGVGRLRPDLSRSSGAQELVRPAGRRPGLWGDWGQEPVNPAHCSD